MKAIGIIFELNFIFSQILISEDPLLKLNTKIVYTPTTTHHNQELLGSNISAVTDPILTKL